MRLVNAKVQRELVAPLPGSSLWLGALGGAAVTALLAFGFSFAHPHIDLFAVPPLGVAGAALQVPYQTGGIGTPAYALEDERGATVASGTLAASSGVFSLPLPGADRTRNYIVRLFDKGALGGVDRAAPVTALPAPAPPQEQLIDAIGIDTSQVPDGGSFTLRYRTRATNGRDRSPRRAKHAVGDGADRAQRHLADLASAFRQGQRTARHARGGTQRTARKFVGRTRRHRRAIGCGRAAIRAARTSPVRRSCRPKPESAPTECCTFRSPPARRNVRLALETTEGATIASQSVPDGATSAAIAIPHGVHGRVVLVTTYNRGSGEESTVKAIDVP